MVHQNVEGKEQIGEGADGARGRNRTSDTAIFSRMLYQLSYLGPGGAAATPESAS